MVNDKIWTSRQRRQTITNFIQINFWLETGLVGRYLMCLGQTIKTRQCHVAGGLTDDWTLSGKIFGITQIFQKAMGKKFESLYSNYSIHFPLSMNEPKMQNHVLIIGNK